MKGRDKAKAREQFAERVSQMIDEAVGKPHKASKGEDPTVGRSVQWDEESNLP